MVNLQAAREALNLSQRKFAKELGVDPGYLSRLESGERKQKDILLRNAVRGLFAYRRKRVPPGLGL